MSRYVVERAEGHQFNVNANNWPDAIDRAIEVLKLSKDQWPSLRVRLHGADKSWKPPLDDLKELQKRGYDVPVSLE